MLNVAYSRIIEHMPTEDEKGNKHDYRGELDDKLETHKWPVPHTLFNSTLHKKKVKSKAPAWWSGDEEASQTFLAAMNAGG